eukprot:COSAG06_NODE_4738_length_3990_cov_593.419429_6_plen_42_part_01
MHVNEKLGVPEGGGGGGGGGKREKKKGEPILATFSKYGKKGA